MNTLEIEIVEEEVLAIRSICAYLNKQKDLPEDIAIDLERATAFANAVIISDDVPF